MLYQLSESVVENFCGSSSVDRALAFQAEGRGFESRLPLSQTERSQIKEDASYVASSFLLFFVQAPKAFNAS